MKNTLLFTYSTNILVHLLTANVRPHSRNSLKMQPHYSQSRRENATPFSCPSPLASYNEVPPPPPSESLLLFLFLLAPEEGLLSNRNMGQFV